MLLERFLRYVRIDTQSQEDVEEVPSTAKQFDLANLLLDELKALGLADARVDKHCYVYATLPSNLPIDFPNKVPAVGFIAHLDTSPSVSGNNVNPLVHEYRGGDIVLPGGTVIAEAESPELKRFRGGTIVTADGTTLLGADDKAGIAVIMEVLERLCTDHGIQHGEVKIAFTPDEEVGRGSEFFDIEGWGARYAYTVDGEKLGELNVETFNAAQAVVTFHGKNTHPGYAKGIMINSQYALADFILALPRDARPETTDGRQGYLHPYVIEGNEEKSQVKVLLRDFDIQGISEKQRTIEEIKERVLAAWPGLKIDITVKERYRNMIEVLRQFPKVADLASRAMKAAGIEPLYLPIRGGTDGAGLSFRGLPAPNIFMGCNNPHGKLEWVALEGMEKSVQTVINLIGLWAEENDAQRL